LVEQAGKNKKLIALDADLILDTGLIPFKDKYPERKFFLGIISTTRKVWTLKFVD
jgi:transketolase